MSLDDSLACATPPASRLAVTRLDAGARLPADEWVAEEVPVALVYNGVSHAVMLVTPQDLEDFALGFSLSEGLIDRPEDLLDCELQSPDPADGPAHGSGETAAGLMLALQVTQRCMVRLKERRRSMAGRTGCGLCGTDSLDEAVRPVCRSVATSAVDASALERAMAGLAAGQSLQQLTGATHAAAWCDLDGEVRLVREDVGRHNALDKLVGAMARARIDPASGFVAVTSRASYEMVHKTASAGVGLLVAISAPTALAVRTAEAAGLTLAGFTRGRRSVLYSQPWRVRSPV
ncbi:FdhD protein [Sphaerotilus hippei]|uniref:Sulfur carrier protein FdhD n=1 Tax=Sphaerotilus hippei TaxID=744406 RepID=A0A318GYE8_9BURK|nr:formate dehydrogenase accessory sulfurtransferase FdhD [Sphaerotilus hippei]PXW93689.1 FdhD protein [Sphaerotilus hippei]